ncbi:MAG: hypothetical protein MJ252_11260 [archaeon]|nr:hypothetical protein [archaeon]
MEISKDTIRFFYKFNYILPNIDQKKNFKKKHLILNKTKSMSNLTNSSIKTTNKNEPRRKSKWIDYSKLDKINKLNKMKKPIRLKEDGVLYYSERQNMLNKDRMDFTKGFYEIVYRKCRCQSTTNKNKFII